MRHKVLSTLSTTAFVLTMLCSTSAFAHGDWHGDGKSGFDQALSQLPQADAAKFRDTMHQAHEQDKANFAKIHALHEELHAILVADKFDKNAFIAKHAKLQVLMDKAHSNMTTAFANAVSQLPQEERVVLADALHDQFKAHHHDHGQEHEHARSVAPAPTGDVDHNVDN